MTILGIDTTGLPVSAAVMIDEIIAGSIYLNIDKKHAETLTPAIDNLLKTARIDIGDIEAVAVSSGPGSFTGIRIGAGCAEGLAKGLGVPIYMVNTLDALLMNISSREAKCALMDAKRNEVYAKATYGGDGIISAAALPLSQVLETLSDFETVIFNGDGATAYKDEIIAQMPDSLILSGQNSLQNAASVCECAVKGYAKIAADGVVTPEYLRLSQAERLKTEKAEANI